MADPARHDARHGMTEKQGAHRRSPNMTLAERDGGSSRITGQNCFMSAPMVRTLFWWLAQAARA